MTGMSWRACAYACATVTVAGIAYCLAGMPLQLSDSVLLMLTAQSSSLLQILVTESTNHAFLRPALWGLVKVLFDLSSGHYFVTFKFFHVMQVAVATCLVLRLLDIRSRLDFVLVPATLAVFIGIHTFAGLVREAYPVNMYLTVVLCCLAGVNVARSKGGWWADLLAVAVFVLALFTLESGVLVWVCLVTGYVVGLRGVSRRAIAAATIVLVGYVLLRFAVLETGLPGLLERDSGYGFSRRTAAELNVMFAGRAFWFYLYNVACSVLTVLFAEPRGGGWELLRRAFQGDFSPWAVINVTSSVLATLVIGRYVYTRRREWQQRRFTPGDQLVVLFLAVLLSNAVVSFPYTKDVIMSPAGAFYAMAFFVAFGDLFSWLSQQRTLLRVAMATGVCLMCTGWAVRAVGLHYNLRQAAFVQRNDWATAEEWLQKQQVTLTSRSSLELVRNLRRQALRMPVPSPHFAQSWSERYFDQLQ